MGRKYLPSYKKRTSSGKPISLKQILARRRSWELRELRMLWERMDFRMYQRWTTVEDPQTKDIYRTSPLTSEERDKLSKALKLIRSVCDEWQLNSRQKQEQLDANKFA